MGVHSPLLNMLPLRIPTWVPQDSVYLVTNIRVAQSRMPRPRYKETFSYFALLSMLFNAFEDLAESLNSHLSSSAMNSAGNDRISLFNVSGLTLQAKIWASSFLRGERSEVFWYAQLMALEVTGGRYFASDFSKFDKFLSFEVFRTGKWIPRSTRIDLAKDDIKLSRREADLSRF